MSLCVEQDELEIVRQINIEYSKTAQDEEQERRVREYEVAKVQDQLLREHSRSEAIEAAEQERLRRISEAQATQELDDQERARKQALAVQVSSMRVHETLHCYRGLQSQSLCHSPSLSSRCLQGNGGRTRAASELRGAQRTRGSASEKRP